MVALDPVFSIGYQLIPPIRRFRGAGRARARRIAAELLGQVGIVDAAAHLRSYPHQLSGGMAQRVCIALALTGSPKLLIADEPTTALDVTVQAEILSLLRSLVQDTCLSVIIVSHDLGVIADLCDEVAVMYAGQVVESGTVAEVLGHPAHPYTAALLGANPHVTEGLPVPERLPAIPGTVPAPPDWPPGCRFASRCPLATDACAQPVPATPAHGTGTHGAGTVRCVHHWTRSKHPPTEHCTRRRICQSPAASSPESPHERTAPPPPAVPALSVRGLTVRYGRQGNAARPSTASASTWPRARPSASSASQARASRRSARPSSAFRRRPPGRSCCTAPTSPGRRCASAGSRPSISGSFSRTRTPPSTRRRPSARRSSSRSACSGCRRTSDGRGPRSR